MNTFQISSEASWVKLANNTLKIFQNSTGKTWLIHDMHTALWHAIWLQFSLEPWQKIIPDFDTVLENWLNAEIIVLESE